MGRIVRRVLVVIVRAGLAPVAVLLGIVALFRHRHRFPPPRRGRDGFGGTAGDRSPLRPVPPTLVNAAAAAIPPDSD